MFTTLREEELNSSGVPNVISQDEVHTYFSIDGMLAQVAFAQTPKLTSPVNNSYYGWSWAEQAAYRVLASYTYTVDGQLKDLTYRYQNSLGSAWQNGQEEISKVEYKYEAPFQLRSRMELMSTYPTGYDYSENYTYHPALDYLTGVDYTDGTAWDKTWTYDVAGNRNDSTVDMLNRQLSSPGFTYTHDAVGNRTYRKVGSVNKVQYDWDAFNRLETYAVPNQGPGITPGTGAASYDYLPNGLRCTKLIDANLTTLEIDPEGDPVLSGFYDDESFDNDTTTRYRYDGQMTMEEDVTYAAGSGTMVDETRYLLGARGIERLEAQRMASPLPNDPLTTAKRSYPLYDGHGNMIATLGRTATGYTIANEKKYDVWGAVRASQSPGSHVVNPNKEYCANLGHTFDGESDLIYMRARYYEPSTGRFVSEDPARDGGNWFVYAESMPTTKADPTGLFTLPEMLSNMDDMLENQLRSAQMGRVTLDHAKKKIHEAIYNWADRIGSLGDDAWRIFDSEKGLIGIQGKFRINIHLTDALKSPHGMPHLQINHINGLKEWAFWDAQKMRWIISKTGHGF